MTEWVLAVEGTEVGRNLAMVLALMAAVLHAVFAAMQKGRVDPWVMRGAMDASYGLMAVPVAIFVVPWPGMHLWPILIGAWAIHTVYKTLQAMAYTRGAYTVVYPIVRGTGPLFTVIGSFLLFGEVFTIGQWMGMGVLLCGIFGLAVYNLRTVTLERETLKMALGLALCTGLCVALYTTYDAYGIRAAADPFTFLAWFFVVDSWAMPVISGFYVKRKGILLQGQGLWWRGPIGGLLAVASFGSILMATRLDKVGEAAVLRETSTIFAALIGWIFLKETVGPRRMALMALIALGAVIVEFAG
ncbi:MAG: DMT family transporter [Planktomarina sp.]|nr:DMT family transporter [Planktomarina sp.]